MADFSLKSTSIRGKKVSYYVSKNGDSKKPIVILHGFMSDAKSLVPFAQNLQGKRDIIIPDLPGFGGSEPLGEDSDFKDYINWVKTFLDQLKVDEPSAIVGYSFGAYIAIMYCSTYKLSRDCKLTLITPVIKIDWRVRMYGKGFHVMAFRAKTLAEKLYLLQYDMTTFYLRKVRHPFSKAQLIRQRRSELEFLQPGLVLNLFKDLINLDLMPYAAKIHQPTIIILADKDNVAANSAARRFAKQVKASVTVMEIRKAGHLLPFEEPVLLGTSLKSYVNDLVEKS